MDVIAYRRVSTTEQGDSGLGLEAQTEAVEQWAREHGHTIIAWLEDVASGGKRDREGIQDAMDRLQRKEADALVVAKVDRLTRSLLQFAEVVETAHRRGWQIVCLDIGMDMTTPSGKAMAGMLAVFAEFERSMVSQRTKAAVERRRVRLGGTLPGTRPATTSPVRKRIARLRARGLSLREIAARLEQDGVPTAQGGTWGPRTVKWVLEH